MTYIISLSRRLEMHRLSHIQITNALIFSSMTKLDLVYFNDLVMSDEWKLTFLWWGQMKKKQNNPTIIYISFDEISIFWNDFKVLNRSRHILDVNRYI